MPARALGGSRSSPRRRPGGPPRRCPGPRPAPRRARPRTCRPRRRRRSPGRLARAGRPARRRAVTTHHAARPQRHDDRPSDARRPRRSARAASSPPRPVRRAGSPDRPRRADSAATIVASSIRLTVMMSASPNDGSIDAARRRRVEDGRRAGRATEPQGRARRGRRDLVADEDDVAGGPGRGASSAGRDVGRATVSRSRPTRPRSRSRRAASTRIRATPVWPSTRRSPLRSMPSRSSAARARIPNASRPTAPTNAVRRTQPRGRDGLVRALAAVVLGEGRPGDRLAGRRQPFRVGDEVDVDRPHDDDAAAHRLPPVSR